MWTGEPISAMVDIEEEKQLGVIECDLKILMIIRKIKECMVEQKEEKLIPLVQWNKHHPDPSIPALRMLVFRKDENGFDDVIERRGRRILINESKYFEWRKTHQCY